LEIVLNKNKQFFSELHKYTLVSRLDKKAVFIKIESKHSVRNNSNETIDIEVGKSIDSITPSQTYHLNARMIK
jgi:hypothetical protein